MARQHQPAHKFLDCRLRATRACRLEPLFQQAGNPLTIRVLNPIMLQEADSQDGLPGNTTLTKRLITQSVCLVRQAAPVRSKQSSGSSTVSVSYQRARCLPVTRAEGPEITVDFAKPTRALDYNCAHNGISPWN